MIGFPCVPEPSSLLWVEDLSTRGTVLRQECERLLAIDRPRSIDGICQDAQGLHKRGDHVGCGVILIHLSDICRKQGRLGPALRFSEQAEEIFAGWPENRVIQNHAAALYSLGLINQLLGLDKEARDYYSEAHEEFTAAFRHWDEVIAAQPGTPTGQEECKQAQKLLEKLIEYVSSARALGYTSAIHAPMLIGCWEPDAPNAKTEKLLFDVTVTGLLVEIDVRLDNDVYHFEHLAGFEGPATLQPGNEYSVVEALPGLDGAFSELKGAQYLLVEEGTEPDAKGIVRKRGEDKVWYGLFRRGSDGRIHFDVAYPDQRFRKIQVIGADDLEKSDTGMIVGMFKAA